jgi:osmotically-inducible protein OsmY
MANKKSDAQLTQDVLDELVWDPAVGVMSIDVKVNQGVVTLTGTSATYASKWEADAAAYRVLGVKSVINTIVVEPAALGVRSHSEIAQDVRTVLALDVAVPDTRIGVSVNNGIVTLTGNVDYYFQREDAEEDAVAIRGVRDMYNQIAILQPASAMTGNISDGIARAFARNAELYDDNVEVSVSATGHVPSRARSRPLASATWRKMSPGTLLGSQVSPTTSSWNNCSARSAFHGQGATPFALTVRHSGPDWTNNHASQRRQLSIPSPPSSFFLLPPSSQV